MDIVKQVRRELSKNADPGKQEEAQRFFKEKIKTYTVTVPITNKIGRAFLPEIRKLPKMQVFKLCAELWKSGYFEEGVIACEWAYNLRDVYEPSDFKAFESWVDMYIDNWAACDTLCNHTIGAFVEIFPAFIKNLKIWAKSKNRWKKRAAAVTLIIPARKGLFLEDIFEIADSLLLDKDDLVQKGCGWMLKAASEANSKQVFDYVLSRKNVMPRTAFRYALEKMPKAWRAKAMKSRIDKSITKTV